MDLERLVDLGEPFGAVGGTPAAAFVERQLQLPQQTHYLFARGNVPHARTGAEGLLVQIVQRGKPARKELAIHHALGKTVDRPKAQSQRQFLQSLGYELLVARPQHRQPVAHHDPVG